MLGVMAFFCAFSVWFMVRRPAQWKSLMAREYVFWAWAISPAFAEGLKRFEERMMTEVIVKWLAVLALAVSSGGFLFFTVWFIWSHVLPHK